MIPESYYVNVDINFKKPQLLVGALPMAVIVSKTASATKKYTSLQQVQSDYALGTEPEVLCATMYFNNGGTDLLIYKQESNVADTDAITDLCSKYSNFIWVTFTAEKNASEIQAIASALKNVGQQLPKFLAQTSNVANLPTTLAGAGLNNVALLYSTEDSITPYSAIVIPAYFSAINLTESNSLLSIVHTQITGVADCDVTTSQLSTLYDENWNLSINLGDRFHIIDGGKMVDGEPIHSAWGFALFKKDAEDTLTNLLLTKLPYDNSSNAVIENNISSVCSKYINCGLIGLEKVYNQATQTVQYGNKTYTTIYQGQVLSNGYSIFSIPVSSATASDRALGQIPPVYIYAIINGIIRIIKLNGEVSL